MSQPKFFKPKENHKLRGKINITYTGGMIPMTADSLSKATETS